MPLRPGRRRRRCRWARHRGWPAAQRRVRSRGDSRSPGRSGHPVVRSGTSPARSGRAARGRPGVARHPAGRAHSGAPPGGSCRASAARHRAPTSPSAAAAWSARPRRRRVRRTSGSSHPQGRPPRRPGPGRPRPACHPRTAHRSGWRRAWAGHWAQRRRGTRPARRQGRPPPPGWPPPPRAATRVPPTSAARYPLASRAPLRVRVCRAGRGAVGVDHHAPPLHDLVEAVLAGDREVSRRLEQVDDPDQPWASGDRLLDVGDHALEHRRREGHVEVRHGEVIRDGVVERVHLHELDRATLGPAADARGIALRDLDEARREVESDDAPEGEPAGEGEHLSLAAPEVDEGVVLRHVPATEHLVELDQVQPVGCLVVASGLLAELQVAVLHDTRGLDAQVPVEEPVPAVLQQGTPSRPT